MAGVQPRTGANLQDGRLAVCGIRSYQAGEGR